MKKNRIKFLVIGPALVLSLFISKAFASEIVHYYNTKADYHQATNKEIKSYKESPFLKNKGLPDVNQRLKGTEVLVEEPQSIGTYGGVATVFTKRPYAGEDLVGFWSQEGFLKLAPDDHSIVLNFAKSLVIEDDNRTVHIVLRKGIKWSDGVPLTTKDIEFWYKDILTNEELNPSPMDYKIKIIDDYRFDVIFDDKNSFLKEYFAHDSGWYLIYPAHYFKKFLPKYNKLVNADAKKAGFNDYKMYLSAKIHSLSVGSGSLKVDENMPTIRSYILTKKSNGYWEFTRNPYYWKVDVTGQQLPYIDKIKVKLVNDVEVIAAKISSGQADWGSFNNSLNKIPIFKQSEKKGHIKTYVWKQPFGSTPMIQFNQAYTGNDKVAGDILKQLDFRIAFSYAINRQKINDTLYFGKGIPSQMTVDPSSAYYKPEYAQAYAQYDPERANQLLDKLGYKWDQSRQYRLRPDGKPLRFIVEYENTEGNHASILEMVQVDLLKVGVILKLKANERLVQVDRNLAGVTTLSCWNGGSVTDILLWRRPKAFVPFELSPGENAWGNKWADWLVGKHKGLKVKGAIEPPQDIKDLYQTYLQLKASEVQEEKLELGHKILQYQADNLLTIGLVASPPFPIVVKDNVKNVPEMGLTAWDNLWGMNYAPEIRYFQKPLYENQKQY